MKNQSDVWFVYDGDCPLCTGAANLFKIREVVGHLHTVNAREEKSHPVLLEANNLGMSLDDGMVIKLENRFYHGESALHVMALIGTNSGFFNRINCFLYRSKLLSRICYPVFRTIRNTTLFIMGIKKIDNLQK